MIHRFVRWFGLDTVFCVISIQLFILDQLNHTDYELLIGLSFVTSLFYMIDRVLDLYLEKEPLNNRQLVFFQKEDHIGITLTFLTLGSFVFWLRLAFPIKLALVGLCLLFLFHLYWLRFRWYKVIKLFLIAFIFTAVMTVCHPVDNLGLIIGLIFFFTLFNLLIHDWIESQHPQLFIPVALVAGLVLYFAFQLSILMFYIWLVSIALNYVLCVFSKRTPYWFEISELIYSFPFLIGVFI